MFVCLFRLCLHGWYEFTFYISPHSTRLASRESGRPKWEKQGRNPKTRRKSRNKKQKVKNSKQEKSSQSAPLFSNYQTKQADRIGRNRKAGWQSYPPVILTSSFGRLFGPVGTFSILRSVKRPSITCVGVGVCVRVRKHKSRGLMRMNEREGRKQGGEYASKRQRGRESVNKESKSRSATSHAPCRKRRVCHPRNRTVGRS